MLKEQREVSHAHTTQESSAELGCGLLWPHSESGSPLVFVVLDTCILGVL